MADVYLSQVHDFQQQLNRHVNTYSSASSLLFILTLKEKLSLNQRDEGILIHSFLKLLKLYQSPRNHQNLVSVITAIPPVVGTSGTQGTLNVFRTN